MKNPTYPCQVEGCKNRTPELYLIMCGQHYKTLTSKLVFDLGHARAQCRALGTTHSEALRQAQQNALRWARDHDLREAKKALSLNAKAAQAEEY